MLFRHRCHLGGLLYRTEYTAHNITTHSSYAAHDSRADTPDTLAEPGYWRQPGGLVGWRLILLLILFSTTHLLFLPIKFHRNLLLETFFILLNYIGLLICVLVVRVFHRELRGTFILRRDILLGHSAGNPCQNGGFWYWECRRGRPWSWFGLLFDILEAIDHVFVRYLKWSYLLLWGQAVWIIVIQEACLIFFALQCGLGVYDDLIECLLILVEAFDCMRVNMWNGFPCLPPYRSHVKPVSIFIILVIFTFMHFRCCSKWKAWASSGEIK